MHTARDFTCRRTAETPRLRASAVRKAREVTCSQFCVLRSQLHRIAIVSNLAVKCSDLRKRYGDVVAVDGLSLDVHRGECFGLLGPNGAGKTTTIEILEGLLSPDSGDVEVLGLRWQRDERELRQRLGIQLQESQFIDKLTVEETLRLFRSFYTRGRAPEDPKGWS